MKDTLVKELAKKLRKQRAQYTRLIHEYADQLETNEQLKDTIALLMQEKEDR